MESKQLRFKLLSKSMAFEVPFFDSILNEGIGELSSLIPTWYQDWFDVISPQQLYIFELPNTNHLLVMHLVVRVDLNYVPDNYESEFESITVKIIEAIEKLLQEKNIEYKVITD